MKLILACVFFGVMLYGCHDLAPFKPVRRVLRRTPKAAPTPPVDQEFLEAPYQPRLATRRRGR